MPVYEFSCEVCGKKFDVVATLKEKDAGLHPVCPYCGGVRVQQVFGKFILLGGGKTDEEFEEEGGGAEDYEESGLNEDEFGDEEFNGEWDSDDELGVEE